LKSKSFTTYRVRHPILHQSMLFVYYYARNSQCIIVGLYDKNILKSRKSQQKFIVIVVAAKVSSKHVTYDFQMESHKLTSSRHIMCTLILPIKEILDKTIIMDKKIYGDKL